MSSHRTSQANKLQDTVTRIDEAINSPNGLAAQMRSATAKLSSVELILAGGIDPATGETKEGLSQKFDGHLKDHWKHERRNRTIFGGSVAILVVVADRILAFLGVK